jgi:hypothetical protein
MVDTFRPLLLTEQAAIIEDPDYYQSWLTKEDVAQSNGKG